MLSPDLRKQLSHVLWIGGATDSGKSTVARALAERHGMYVYHYDRTDALHHQKLAMTIPEVRKFTEASLDERWVDPEPDAMLQYFLHVSSYRCPLVIDDLLAFPHDKPVIAEGFGLLPELIRPLLSSPDQAVWFVPTEAFKRDSMTRRGKPSFANQTRDPERARSKLLARDMLLADYYRKQVPAFGYTLCEIDGSVSIEQMTALVNDHFARYLACLR